MEFSELFCGKCCIFSPNGKFLSCLCGDSVEVRFADSLLKAFKFECGDVVKVAMWSGDSALILCHTGQSVLKVFSITSGSCIATLKQETGCIKQVLWTADHRSIMFLEPHLFRFAIWSLCDLNGQLGINYVKNAQPWAKPSIALSPNGKFLAIVICGVTGDTLSASSNPEFVGSVNNTTDDIAILSAISWRQEKIIPAVGIQRVGGVEWSPNSAVVVVWSSHPLDPVLILSVRSGSIINKWQPSEKLWPGVCGVQFSPSAQFLTIASWNSKVHILNCVAWCEELEMFHDSSSIVSKTLVYQEISRNSFETSSFVEVTVRPVNISFLSSPGKPGKTSRVAWSSGGRYIASCLALAPAVVWIWSSANSFQLHCVIAAKYPVKDFLWDPARNILAVVRGDDCVLFFNADDGILKSLHVCTPVSRMLFQAIHLNWRHDGKAITASSGENSTLLELFSLNE